MNKYRFRLNNTPVSGTTGDLKIDLPLLNFWDLGGVNDSIDIFENEIIRQVINPIDDFETTRYSHKPYLADTLDSSQFLTSTNYEFYFYSGQTDASITASTVSDWVTDYRANGLSTVDVLFRKRVFEASFFKLDFYDTKNSANQQIYLTIIIPTHQGAFETVPYGESLVNIKKPVFNLDFVGDKEGYFIYWLKDTEFVNLNTLYMSAKFYDARIGQFKRMMSEPQGRLSEKFRFNNEDYFYYLVDLNYEDYTYEIKLQNPFVINTRVGIKSSPIKWYEYVNPPKPPVVTGALPTPTPLPTPNKFLVRRCDDDKEMYAVDNSYLNIVVGDFVKISGRANTGCWEVVSKSTVTGASILSKHTDCSCN